MVVVLTKAKASSLKAKLSAEPSTPSNANVAAFSAAVNATPSPEATGSGTSGTTVSCCAHCATSHITVRTIFRGTLGTSIRAATTRILQSRQPNLLLPLKSLRGHHDRLRAHFAGK